MKTKRGDRARARKAWRWVVATLLTVVLVWPLLSSALAQTSSGSAAAAIDLPACRDVPAQPNATPPVRVGLAQPGDAALAKHLVNMAAFYDDVTACAETWRDVLPLATPLAKQAALEKHFGWAAYIAAFLLTVLLARFLTPTKWWTRFNLFAALVLVGGTWGIATALMATASAAGLTQKWFYDSVTSLQIGIGSERWAEVSGVRGFDQWLAKAGFNPNFSTLSLNVRALDGAPLIGYADPAAGSGTAITEAASGLVTTGRRATTQDGRVLVELRGAGGAGATYWVDAGSIAVNPPAAKAGDVFRVHLPLNFRTGPGVDHPRITTLARGASVITTGKRSGDWWEVKVVQSGAETTGWVSSLWLRRVREASAG